ncbi:hypothetical protein LCGC14_1283320 [marine sediment metagenome]|uniref:Uncharacterized protein n=1 Tax=marine sediment metagenome TaxID=412755 RepID=A0A0F9NB55_9ZZZZ
MSEPELKEKIEKILEEGIKDMTEKLIEAIKEEKNTNNPIWE